MIAEVDVANFFPKLAGEDLTNDRIKVSSEVTQLVIPLSNGSVAANGTIVSSAIDISNFRYYSIMAVNYTGGSGTSGVNVHIDVSPNGGNDYQYELTADVNKQYVYIHPTQVLMQIMRVTLTNTYTATSSINGWIVLGK